MRVIQRGLPPFSRPVLPDGDEGAGRGARDAAGGQWVSERDHMVHSSVRIRRGCRRV